MEKDSSPAMLEKLQFFMFTINEQIQSQFLLAILHAGAMRMARKGSRAEIRVRYWLIWFYLALWRVLMLCSSQKIFGRLEESLLECSQSRLTVDQLGLIPSNSKVKQSYVKLPAMRSSTLGGNLCQMMVLSSCLTRLLMKFMHSSTPSSQQLPSISIMILKNLSKVAAQSAKISFRSMVYAPYSLVRWTDLISSSKLFRHSSCSFFSTRSRSCSLARKARISLSLR